MPPEVLADDISKFEGDGSAATEIGLPMNMILGQLPSGKVEMALQDLIPHFPAGFLQPTESITNYLPTLISLPLMDVVMRIPPDLLALRPDQKDVDASVINMADPFTEEILREQAEAARKAAAAQTNIIEESQAPQEEFVPSGQAGTAKAIVPPRRIGGEPMAPTVPVRPPHADGVDASADAARDQGADASRVWWPEARPRCASASLDPRAEFGAHAYFAIRLDSCTDAAHHPVADPAPSPGHDAVRSASRCGCRPARAAHAPEHRLDSRAASAKAYDVGPASASAPDQPAARHRHGQPPTAPAVAPATPVASADPNSDDLQRLAALAMAQLGDSTESQGLSASTPTAPDPEAACSAGSHPIRSRRT